jgi:hypothetical protein
VLVASLDGTNVRLHEAGPKRGRPASGTPGESDPTGVKNAMAGTVSFDGAVPQGEATPDHLDTHDTAHMPEADCGTFRLKFEAELTNSLAKIGDSIAKVVVLDGAKALGCYGKSRPLYAGFETILDFFHATEHLSSAANALFGKGTPEAKVWSDRYRGVMVETNSSGVSIVRAIDSGTWTLSASAKAAVAEQRRFFSNNKDRMSYAKFHEKG